MDRKNFIDYFLKHLNEAELSLSVDCVLFTIQEGRLKVLLTKFLPESKWMLPGGFINKDEEADEAATRVLFQRTGLSDIFLQQFKVFTNPDRFSFSSLILEMPEALAQRSLPDRVVSIGYFALVNYELLELTGGELGEDSCWADVAEVPTLEHDHNLIIIEAQEALRKELFFRPIAYNLLPGKFTMPELQKLHEIILDRVLERSSFQKRMLRWNIYDRLEERREGVAHKRPYLYRFNQDKYEEALKRGIRFWI